MKEQFKKVGSSLLSWSWTKTLLYWIVISAGTASECLFLIASLWMTINASVHSFVLLLVPEQTTIHLSQLATVAYVALPECILALAIVTTLSHIRVWAYSGRKDKAALTWSVLYGVPTIIFLVLSLITIGFSMLSVTFQLPPYMIVIRGLSGYGYGLIALLYTQLGIPQERDRLQQKDGLLAQTSQANEISIATLRNEKDMLIVEAQKQINALTDELAKANALIAPMQKQIEQIANLSNNGHEDALQAYSEGCKAWLAGDAKTVSIESIMEFTGHPKRTVMNAIRAGKLQTHSRNRNLVAVPSLVEWLAKTPPTMTREEVTKLHIVNR